MSLLKNLHRITISQICLPQSFNPICAGIIWVAQSPQSTIFETVYLIRIRPMFTVQLRPFKFGLKGGGRRIISCIHTYQHDWSQAQYMAMKH